MPPASPAPRPAAAWIFLPATAAYLLAFRLSFWSVSHGESIAPIWLATGLAVWLVLQFGYRMLWVVVIGEVIAKLTHQTPGESAGLLLMRVVMSTGNVLTVFLGAWIWRRLQRDTAARLGGFAEPLACFTTALLAPVLAATLGIGALVLAGQRPTAEAGHLWFAWWTGDVIGVLFVLPLLLAAPDLGRGLTVRRLAGYAAILTLTVGLCWLAFWRPAGGRVLFAVFPLLMLATICCGAPGARLTAFLLVTAGTVAAALGHGPLVTGELRQDLLTVQLFFAAIAVLTLVLPPLHARLDLSRPQPLALLAIGWALSGMMFGLLEDQTRRQDESTFIQLTDDAQKDIQRQLVSCTDLLWSGASFLPAVPDTGPTHWADFMQSIDLPQRFPGMLSLGVVYPVAAQAADTFQNRVRAAGTPDFTIHPLPGATAPAGAERIIVTYVAPRTGNEAALGLDLSSDPVRRLAVEAARDTGRPQMSGRIQLIQDHRNQPGFLLVVPVYRPGAPLATVAQRRAALLAWVDAPLQTAGFLLGALGENAGKLRVHLFDGGVRDPAHLIFDSGPDEAGMPEFERVTRFELAGHPLLLGWNRGPGLAPTPRSPLIWMALSLAVITVLLTGWVLSLQAFRAQAEMQVATQTAALTASEGRFRTLIEKLPEAVVVHRDGRFLYGNPAALRLIGAASSADLFDHPVLERIHPDSRPAATDRLRQVNERGQDVPQMRMKLLRLDGTIAEVETQATAISFNGTPAVHVLLHDVTDRNRAEAARREALERLQKIASRVPGVVYQYRLRPDGSACFPFASDAIREIYGVSPEQVREDATAVFQVLHPDDRARVAASIHESAAQLTPWTCEFRVRLPDDRTRWLLGNATPQREPDGGTLWHGFITDITERKLAEAELRESKQKLVEIMDNVPAFIYLKDPAGRYLFANRKACELFHRPLADVVGRPDENFFDTTTCAKIRSNDRQVLVEGKTLKTEETNLNLTDGSVATYLSVKLPLRNESGAIYALCGISTDITESRRAEQEQQRLEETNWQLQKAESLGRMASAIAHHFNNQLHAVMMNLEMACADLPGRSPAAERLAEAMACARKATEISTHMLTYLGQTQGKTTPQDLADICRATLPLLHATVPRHVALEVRLPNPGPVINANLNQLQQVLTNLLTNAWEACGSSPGRIQLTVRTASAREIPAQHLPADWQPQHTAYACLEIADTGAGLSPAEAEKIFDPFYSSKFVGRGLGLPVVLGIVRAHHGAIAMTSEPGRGTVFLLYFPLALRAAEPPSRPAKAAEKSSAGQTVLVAEDDPLVLNITVRALLHFGFKVLAAKDGVEAIELFHGHRADIGCVVCDLSMPRLGGWETIAELRRLAPGLPIILSSGHDESQVMAGDHAEKPQAMLHKPYDAKVLLSLVHQVMAATTPHG